MAGFYRDNNKFNILLGFQSGNVDGINKYYKNKESIVLTFLSYIQRQEQIHPIEYIIISQYYKLLEQKARGNNLVIILESYDILQQIFRLLPEIYYSPLVDDITFLKILEILGNIINLHVVDKDVIVQALNLIFSNENYSDKEIYISSKFQTILSVHPCYLYIFETTSLKNIEHENEKRQIEERQKQKKIEQGLNVKRSCIAQRLSQISFIGSGSEDCSDSDEIPELVSNI
jgi:hypothetical protein